MNYRYVSLHNHCSLCDGVDTLEDMTLAAIALGLDTIGFSPHSNVAFDEQYCMSVSATQTYGEELKRLNGVYGNRIEIFGGIEQDFYSQMPTSGYAFVIGSVHFVRQNGRYCEVDLSKDASLSNIQTCFCADAYAYTEAYYETVAQFAGREDVDIIGHFDVVTKFNENNAMFDEQSARYYGPALDAMRELVNAGKIFEMNSGAVSRGYRSSPYISVPLLKELHRMGGRVTLSADAHRTKHILYLFDEMADLLKACGFEEFWQFNGAGFYPTHL